MISVSYMLISHCFAGSWARPQRAPGIWGRCWRRSLPNFPGQLLKMKFPVQKYRRLAGHNHIYVHRICFARLRVDAWLFMFLPSCLHCLLSVGGCVLRWEWRCFNFSDFFHCVWWSCHPQPQAQGWQNSGHKGKQTRY